MSPVVLPAPPPWEVTEADLRSLKNRLKLNLPTEYPVKYRRVEIKTGEFGDCDLVAGKNGPYFSIRIDKRLPLVAQWLIITHEYAHALQWRGPVAESMRLDDHDAEWSLAEARVWTEVGG